MSILYLVFSIVDSDFKASSVPVNAILIILIRRNSTVALNFSCSISELQMNLNREDEASIGNQLQLVTRFAS